MIARRSLLLSCISVVVLHHSAATYTHDSTLQAWEKSYLDRMTEQELQMTANYFYLLLSTTVLEWQSRQFPTAIAKLNQTIHNKIGTYQNPAEDIAMLRTLLERLSHVINARTIYIQTLSTCATYLNNNPAQFTQLMQTAALAAQTDIQNKLTNWADQQSENTQEILRAKADFIENIIQHFQETCTVYKEMSDGKLPIDMTPDGSNNQSLIALYIMLQKNSDLLDVTAHITNSINESNDHVSKLIATYIALYKEYYTALYTKITSPAVDQRYATTLFGMYSELPDEYKTILPDADHIFEHILQTTKLYTQIEFSQQ